jgi:hypothetical protein
MNDNKVASALKRAQAIYEPRPGSALHADPLAVAHGRKSLARAGCLARANDVELGIEVLR